MEIIIITIVVIATFLFARKKHKKDEFLVFTPQFTDDVTDDELQIIKLVNIYRDKNEKSILNIEKLHMELAQTRVDYMIDIKKPTHKNFLLHNRILKERQVHCAENIAYAYYSVLSIINAWKNSNEHNENLLADDWEYIGVSAKTDIEGRLYCVLILGYYHG